MEISYDSEKGVLDESYLKSRIFEVINKSNTDISEELFDTYWLDFLELMEEKKFNFSYGNTNRLCIYFRSFLKNNDFDLNEKIKQQIKREYTRINILVCLDNFIDINGTEKKWSRAKLEKFSGKFWSGSNLLGKIFRYSEDTSDDHIEKKIESIAEALPQNSELKRKIYEILRKCEINPNNSIGKKFKPHESSIHLDLSDYKMIGEIDFSQAKKIEGICYRYSENLSSYGFRNPITAIGKQKEKKIIQGKKVREQKLEVFIEKSLNYQIIDGEIINIDLLPSQLNRVLNEKNTI